MNNAEVLRGDTSIKTSIEIDFEEFCGDALDILLYGAHTQGRWSERSDTDICIVAPGNDYVLRRFNKRLGRKFDIKMVKSNV